MAFATACNIFSLELMNELFSYSLGLYFYVFIFIVIANKLELLSLHFQQ